MKHEDIFLFLFVNNNVKEILVSLHNQAGSFAVDLFYVVFLRGLNEVETNVQLVSLSPGRA